MDFGHTMWSFHFDCGWLDCRIHWRPFFLVTSCSRNDQLVTVTKSCKSRNHDGSLVTRENRELKQKKKKKKKRRNPDHLHGYYSASATKTRLQVKKKGNPNCFVCFWRDLREIHRPQPRKCKANQNNIQGCLKFMLAYTWNDLTGKCFFWSKAPNCKTTLYIIYPSWRSTSSSYTIHWSPWQRGITYASKCSSYH